jgi:hypothetical protein
MSSWESTTLFLNPKYWVTAMPRGILFEIWPLEKERTLTSHPSRVSSKQGLWGPDYLLDPVTRTFSDETITN